MTRQFVSAKFGAALRTFRKRDREMTLARLAREITKVAGVRISTTALHYLEVGRYKKSPGRETIRGLARALRLSPGETQQLLELGGYAFISESLLERAVESVRSVLQIANGRDAEAFIQHVESTADRYARCLGARNEDVTIALIPIAGWQARMLAPEILERTLVPALHEVTRSGIREVVLIVAPGAASRWSLGGRFRELVLRTIEQDQPTGLARALAMGRPPGHLGPIAVLLPDEVDPQSEALKDLVYNYRLLRRPVIAVNPSSVEKERHENLRYYGVAVLRARRVTGQNARLRELESPLMEKPQEPRAFPPLSRKIAGRYILTPEVFETMQTTGPELTAALNEHWKGIYAYELRKDLIALSPYKEIIEVISSVECRLLRSHQTS